ncbi:MAG: hypothetical protein IPK17_17570 [Chloroflexi bacterium]|uniref:hypothetical protein n=1 Tax=Candidatus Flexifilum breve TaxID=3140694 RepID=UPI003134BEF9|nr:hypothetical protein [Chloroflexota bacterium]
MLTLIQDNLLLVICLLVLLFVFIRLTSSAKASAQKRRQKRFAFALRSAVNPVVDSILNQLEERIDEFFGGRQPPTERRKLAQRILSIAVREKIPVNRLLQDPLFCRGRGECHRAISANSLKVNQGYREGN